MKWEDTVIKAGDCKYQPDGDKDELWADLGSVYQSIYLEGCRAQAAISFKAGEQLSLEKQGQAYLEGKQAGRKDVVDWVEIVDTVELDGAKQYTITLEQWQAKMKGWGL